MTEDGVLLVARPNCYVVNVLLYMKSNLFIFKPRSCCCGTGRLNANWCEGKGRAVS